MSSRRQRLNAGKRLAPGVVPAVLKASGVTDVLWTDPVSVDRWCERHGLQVPPSMFWTSPRALRDHAAVSWSVKHFPHARFHGPDWAASARAGVGPISGARMAARHEAATGEGHG